jgi:hypothetical protein
MLILYFTTLQNSFLILGVVPGFHFVLLCFWRFLSIFNGDHHVIKTGTVLFLPFQSVYL